MSENKVRNELDAINQQISDIESTSQFIMSKGIADSEKLRIANQIIDILEAAKDELYYPSELHKLLRDYSLIRHKLVATPAEVEEHIMAYARELNEQEPR